MTQASLYQVPSGYRTQAPDTSIEIERILIQRWRKLSEIEKAQLVRHSTHRCWYLSLVGIFNQYPGATLHKIRREFIRRRLGVEWVETLCSQDGWENAVDITELKAII
jgi:hypothetical protein